MARNRDIKIPKKHKGKSKIPLTSLKSLSRNPTLLYLGHRQKLRLSTFATGYPDHSHTEQLHGMPNDVD